MGTQTKPEEPKAPTEKTPETQQGGAPEVKGTPAGEPEKKTDTGEALLGTSANLFPELQEKREAPTKEPTPLPEKQVTAEEGKPKGTEQPATPPPGDKELGLDEIADQKFRVKVDGKEMVVSGKDLLKGYQTDQYLTQKGQRLGDQERAIQEMVNKMNSKLTGNPQPEPTPATPGTPPAPEEWTEDQKELVEVMGPLINPILQSYKAKIMELEGVVTTLAQETQPSRKNATLEAINKDLISEGHKDFMEYFPKIEEAMRDMSEEEYKQRNTIDGVKDLYRALKLADLMKGKSTDKTDASGPDRQASPPTSESDDGPPFVSVESGGGSPSGSHEEDKVTGNKLFEDAKKTGNWTPYLDWKGALK